MLQNIIIISLIIYFIKATTWSGMIFEKVGVRVEDLLGEYWSKPVLGCPVCMAPWWGTLLYIFAHYLNIQGFEDIRVQTIVLTVFSAGGVNTIILMLNKEYDVAKKEDKILEEELEEKGIENKPYPRGKKVPK